MSNADSGLLLTSQCTFELNINDPIPDDSKLATPTSKCAMREADSIILFSHSDGSCYGEVSIDYDTKKMMIKLTHVSSLESVLSPYDDMFGFLNGITSVAQYKINGNLETEQIQMTTRIQCKTYDNCALDKLRKLLPNLIISEPRQNIFKELIKFLNTPESTPSSKLTCIDDNNGEIQCAEDETRCKFDHSKSGLTQSCTIEDSDIEYDLEYRFNVIEEMKESGTDNSAEALKCFYLCKTDVCNSNENFKKVDKLLNAFAMTSASHTNSQTTNGNKPAPQIDNKESNKPKSDGLSFIISFYSRSIIIFSLFIQIFSN